MKKKVLSMLLCGAMAVSMLAAAAERTAGTMAARVRAIKHMYRIKVRWS